MSKPKDPSAQAAQEIAGFLKKLSPKTLIVLLFFGLLVAGAVYLVSQRHPAAEKSIPPGTYLFCSWNVENFYDDENDPKNDDHLENWFAEHPDMFQLKVQHLTDALLLMNDGRGPDILAVCEVESERCMNALKDSLNNRLANAGKSDAKYEHVLFLPDHTGRRFAPGILTRLPVEANRTRRISSNHANGRTIEGHITSNDNDLIVLVAHWTSRVEHPGKASEDPEHANRRMSYAKDCYGRFKAILTSNPDADVILCGDFNDEFSDPSIRDGLHASGDVDEVRNAIDDPRPLDLFANWPRRADPRGSIYGKGRWSIFDHICVSRGLLRDKGWSCDLTSARIFAPAELRDNKGEPFRFIEKIGVKHGYSDHFPVTALLKVN